MNGISKFFDFVINAISRVPFDTLLLIDLCSFCGVFVLTLILCLASRKLRHADKRPFFHFVNAFSAVTLALFATRYNASISIAATALFWCVGYLLYALLCAITRRPKIAVERASAPVPVIQPAPIAGSVSTVPSSAPPAQNVVRLDHALSIADKLLLKTLGRGDRQELEKIKTALTVLKVKGELSPQDGEALNDMFNALLKLMAKYDV